MGPSSLSTDFLNLESSQVFPCSMDLIALKKMSRLLSCFLTPDPTSQPLLLSHSDGNLLCSFQSQGTLLYLQACAHVVPSTWKTSTQYLTSHSLTFHLCLLAPLTCEFSNYPRKSQLIPARAGYVVLCPLYAIVKRTLSCTPSQPSLSSTA